MNTHEFLSLNKPAKNEAVVERIQMYYMDWMKRLKEDIESFGRELTVEIIIDGKPACQAGDPQVILKALQVLPESGTFSIDVLTRGFYEDEGTSGLYLFLDEIKATEDITYKFLSFSEETAEFQSRYIANGKSGSLPDVVADTLIADKEMSWYSWGCDLYVEFDFDKYSNIVDRLHDAVRKYLPADQIEFAESDWTGENANPGALIPDLQWTVCRLKEIMVFLDEVNDILSTLDSNYEIKAAGRWFDLEHFATTEWMIFDKKLKLISANH